MHARVQEYVPVRAVAFDSKARCPDRIFRRRGGANLGERGANRALFKEGRIIACSAIYIPRKMAKAEGRGESRAGVHANVGGQMGGWADGLVGGWAGGRVWAWVW